ncbi:DNA-processing protein DprA [Paenibacillus hodogayensis]|uniref:DNA-processing protein DprA n=1 Tax=Paenibacillus hodogayensis TaxID=279208 RepID=A0ABV5W2G6_9BACL
MLNDRIVLFGLHELKGIGWKTIERLVAATSGALSGLLAAEPADLAGFGLKPNIAVAICDNLTEDFIVQRLELYRTKGIAVLTALDANYPPLLKEIAQPPWVLYVRGDARLLSNAAIAMVGTRSPTAYGKKMAYELGKKLADAGVCVASGLARGIDASAHRGALAGAGSTIAVLGCGADSVYPVENASLAIDIIQKGVIVTEYPIGTAIRPGLFPQRNRIISGLSLGTVVVEAAERSGSLITADQALEQSRDVFAVPGPATSPKSSGTLELIRQGAKMVARVEDILEEYPGVARTGGASGRNSAPTGFAGTGDERKLLDLLAAEPVAFDELLVLTGYEFGHLHSVLLNLILKKEIEPLPGSFYTKL